MRTANLYDGACYDVHPLHIPVRTLLVAERDERRPHQWKVLCTKCGNTLTTPNPEELAVSDDTLRILQEGARRRAWYGDLDRALDQAE